MRLPEELQFIQNSRIPPAETNARLDGKTALITGATSVAARDRRAAERLWWVSEELTGLAPSRS